MASDSRSSENTLSTSSLHRGKRRSRRLHGLAPLDGDQKVASTAPAIAKTTATQSSRYDASTFEQVLRDWCNDQLAPGKCYGSVLGQSFTQAPPDAVALVYQDGTACSASYCFSDVYECKDGTYVVQTDVGVGKFTGDSPHSEGNDTFCTQRCATLLDVLNELLLYCGHDPNSTGELVGSLTGYWLQCVPLKQRHELDRDVKHYLSLDRFAEYPQFDAIGWTRLCMFHNGQLNQRPLEPQMYQ